MKRFLCIILAAVVAIIPAGCGAKPSAVGQAAAPVYPKPVAYEDYDARREVRENNPVDERTINAVKEFSFETAALVLPKAELNACYSPVSLYYALALAASGAGGDTRGELLELLGADDTLELSQQMGNLYRLMYTDNEISKLKIANSLWLDDEVNGQRVTFEESFLKNAAENFYASVFSVDFSGDSAGREMSKWISDNTNGKLTPQFNPDPEQLMSIINTVYFYDQWIDRFDPQSTAKGTFHLEGGGAVECDFMNTTFGSHGFTKGEGFTGSYLGLKNGGRMVFILPDEGAGMGELLSSPGRIAEIFSDENSQHGLVVWSLPKFKHDSNFALKDALTELGMQAAFEPGADFSGITPADAFISDISQQTHIAIDENGVEAAAFTKIDFAGTAMPQGRAEMILDRPFIYGVTGRDGIPLFIGVCKDPTK